MLTVNETKTVEQIANLLDVTQLIHRALSYNPKFLNGYIWTVPVSLSFKLKTTAGNANLYRIHLHPGLIQATFSEQQEIFLHELAHVMDCIQNGKSGHDYSWQEQMIRLAQNPMKSRYHNISSCKSRKERPNLLTEEDITF